MISDPVEVASIFGKLTICITKSDVPENLLRTIATPLTYGAHLAEACA